MSSVEERAKELYPTLETDKIGNNPYISYNVEQLAKQEGFIDGYHQAERDLELSWEDIKTIDDILIRLDDMEETIEISNKEFYKEVLKRFKEKKGESQ